MKLMLGMAIGAFKVRSFEYELHLLEHHGEIFEGKYRLYTRELSYLNQLGLLNFN